MKKFSKIAFLQRNGLLNRKYNETTRQFEFSCCRLAYSYLTLIAKVTLPLKLFISLFWEREHVYQLWIG